MADESLMGPNEAMAELLRQKHAAATGKTVNFFDWALKVPEPKAGKLDFDRFPFQKELYSQDGAMDREQVVKKATQLGISAFLLRWALFHCDTRRLTALYVFPKRKQMYDFSLPAGEQVLMADGTRKPIEEIAEGDRVLSFDGAGVVLDTVTRAWENGVQPILRTELKGGRVLRSTPWHRVWTDRGWVKVGELAEGDQVAVGATLPSEEARGDLSADDAFLIALWLAEGSKTRAGFTVTSSQPHIRQRVFAIAERRGWTVYEGDRGSMALTKGWAKKGDTPANFLKRYGLRGMRTDTIEAPGAVLESKSSGAAEFLRTYLECDGCVTAKTVSVASASERMIRDLLIIAARFGAVGRVTSHQPAYRGAKRSWTAAFHRAEARQALLDLKPVEGAGEVELREVVAITEEPPEETFDMETEVHHAFLTEGAVTHNSDARVSAAIKASPYLKKRIPASEVSNKGLKRIGLGWLYARGSESKDDLDSVDADVLCLDEYDTLRQENIPDAERRISGAENGLIRRVGVPSIPGFGIDALYQKTDQRRWAVKCGHCGEWQPLTFKDNVDLARKARVCHKCHGELTPDDVRAGEWVATYPERDVKGYHLPRLIVPSLDLTDIIAASEKTKPNEKQVHFNKDLAEAYAPEEGRLSDAAIEAAERSGVSANTDGVPACDCVTMGVDVGSVKDLNVRVSAVTIRAGGLPVKRCLFMGAVDSFAAVEALIERYGVNMAVIDHEPDGRSARATAERFAGRVYLGHFITPRSDTVLKVDDEMRKVGVKRTELLDATFDGIRQQRNLLPKERPAGWDKQMQALNRQIVETGDGGVRGEYLSVAQDDYAFAEAYDTLALQVYLWHVGVAEAEIGETMTADDLYEFDRTDLSRKEREYAEGYLPTYGSGFLTTGDAEGMEYDAGFGGDFEYPSDWI